ncbi:MULTISPECIES: DegV family protein [unclassified Halanaerobium]|uniref:DegV family protein n=1 Tax=unclassified Halanaerobium TaxID=2641197 RepID=UPI000DF40437|nr:MULTISPECIES: DegV family protein [unclassified Halanaerobium]RCW51425.1 DegV family protein with EDD domain [Halanaerobium sp. MA284_MarDTE_T2]RCW89214.1 DegV family protein with EDD domain [Halanaerobium sp. DL-01]
MIALVTDSTCDLSEKILNKYKVEVVPLSVHFGEKVYQDKIDLKTDDFFSMMEKSQKLPTTSQPSVGMFLEKYEKLAENYDQIISIHLSAALSGTYKSAKLASSEIEKIDVAVLDSKSTTAGLGFLVIMAAKLINKGLKFNEIIKKIESAREKLTIFFTVNELTYLEKGGRIGKAQSLIGNILNFNPVLEISGLTGEVEPKEKVRGYKRTNRRLTELTNDYIADSSQVNISFVYGRKTDNYNQFKNFLQASLLEKENLDYNIFSNKIGAVLGCHAGPLVYGVVVLKGELLD